MVSKRTKISGRRNFLKNSSLGFLSAGLMSKDAFSDPENTTEDKIPIIKEYRTLGRTGFKVSDIGRGYPEHYSDDVFKLLLKTGVNYIDTSERYGTDESNIGNCIKEFDRKSLFITTKVSPKSGFETKEQIINRVRKCLERLQTDYIDCLMIHSALTIEIIKNEAFHAAVSQLRSEGKVRFCGVSCHGSFSPNKTKETMEEILMAAVEDGRFDVLLLVYNFIAQDMGKKILKACKEKNIGTVIMKSDPYSRYFDTQEYIKLNFTEKNKPVPEYFTKSLTLYEGFQEQGEIFAKKHNLKNKEEIRHTAIRFVLDNSDVNCVLNRFRTFDDVEKVIRFSGTRLKSSDRKMLKEYEKNFGAFYCRHACGLCEHSCPYNVPVNTIMRYDQYFRAQKLEKYAMEKYAALPGAKADLCKDCEGFCESSCPYNVPIQGLLNMAHNKLTLA